MGGRGRHTKRDTFTHTHTHSHTLSHTHTHSCVYVCAEHFSSKHTGAWYPLNSALRRSQPPSMVSLPPVRLPPLSAGQQRRPDSPHTRTHTQQQQQQHGTHNNSNSSYNNIGTPPRRPHSGSESHWRSSDQPLPSSSPSPFQPDPTAVAWDDSGIRVPTAVAWRRMRMANARAVSGAGRATPPLQQQVQMQQQQMQQMQQQQHQQSLDHQ